MANKMTHRDYFNAILSKYPLTDKEKDFVKGRIEALDKKVNSVKSKVSEKDKARLDLMNELLGSMGYGEKYTITEMIKSFPCVKELTNQKVSALIRSLIADGKVIRTESKGKAYFEVANPTDEE